MKIKRDRLVQIIKEELDDYQMSMAQDDPEEFLASGRAEQRIEEIDRQIASLEAEKEYLLSNISHGDVTYQQSLERGSNE